MAATAAQRQVPGTPHVTAPTPIPEDATPGEGNNYQDYFGSSADTGSAVRRSKRLKDKESSPSDSPSSSIDGGSDGKKSILGRVTGKGTSLVQSPDPEARARSRSRSIDNSMRYRRLSGTPAKPDLSKPQVNGSAGPKVNGHLSPADTARKYWREFSRSPSPLGLIPIHREWRSFIHRNEVPRKAMHVSIGFLSLFLYSRGYQTHDIHPPLLTLLIPITLVEALRHNYAPFNRFYIRTLGAFMRESEAHDRYNGVIWYLLGAWSVMRYCPKDLGVMSVILLSWCDTAASTFGRLYGRHTPRVRKGKSLAGSIAACVVGLGAAAFFWGWFAPRYEALGVQNNTGEEPFAFQRVLSLPVKLRGLLGLSAEQATVRGGLAVGIMSAWAGVVASVSEAMDIFGWDDNVTIPVLCGMGLWGFLKVCGSA